MSDEVNMEEFQPCTSDLLMGLTGVVLGRQVSAIKDASRGDMTSGIETLDEAQSDSATGGSSPTEGGPREFDNALSEEILRSLGVWPPVEVDRLCTEDRRTRFLVEGLLPVESI